MDNFSSYHSDTYGSSSGRQNLCDFSWDIIRFIMEGNSPIDIKALTVSDRAQAHQFLLNYGYNVTIPEDRSTLEEIFNESIRFIKTYFSCGHSRRPAYITVPSEIERLNDVRDLLIWASGPRDNDRQAWACAILRIMHTIHHLDNTMRVEFFPEIKRQILNRFKNNITETAEGKLFLGDGANAVPLYGIFYKEEKTRDSLIFKLLHKPKNVSEKIHDRLGVKLVTYNRLDVVKAVYYLYTKNIITFANLTPGRSRNTLIDLEQFKPIFYELFDKKNNASEQEHKECLERRIEELKNDSFGGKDLTASREEYNPSSSKDYQSLQFTVQQLVKLENPGFFKTRRLRTQLEKYHIGPDLEGLMQELEGPGTEKEFSLLFPLEVQIIDKENYLQSIEGTASHEAYKQRQQDLACLRVLAGLFALHPELDPKNQKESGLSFPGL